MDRGAAAAPSRTAGPAGLLFMGGEQTRRQQLGFSATSVSVFLPPSGQQNHEGPWLGSSAARPVENVSRPSAAFGPAPAWKALGGSDGQNRTTVMCPAEGQNAQELKPILLRGPEVDPSAIDTSTCTNLNKGLAQNDQNCGIHSGKQGRRPSKMPANNQHRSDLPSTPRHPRGQRQRLGRTRWGAGGAPAPSTTEPSTLLLAPPSSSSCSSTSLNEIASHGRFSWQFFKLLPCTFQKANEL